MSEKTPEIIQAKKISCKVINNNKSFIGAVTEDEPNFDIMTVYGTVTGSKLKSHPEYGDATGLKGAFKAVRKSDKQIFVSNTAWLPDLIIDSIIPVLKMSEGGAIDFAYDISLAFDESSARGYVYVCKPLIKQASDPLAALEMKIFKVLGLPEPPKDNKAKNTDNKK